MKDLKTLFEEGKIRQFPLEKALGNGLYVVIGLPQKQNALAHNFFDKAVKLPVSMLIAYKLERLVDDGL